MRRILAVDVDIAVQRRTVRWLPQQMSRTMSLGYSRCWRTQSR